MRKIESIKRIVIKVGTTTLTHESGKLNLKRIEKLSWVLSDLHNSGYEVVLVSSGAIAVGADRLGLTSRPRDVQGKQAASAVGQAILMQIYENFFMQYNQIVAQILLTKDVVDFPVRRSHAKNTFSALLELGVIPIVNENDTVAVDEIEFSDNDTLSAYVADLIDADALIILSDIDGLYDGDPHKNSEAKLISEVDIISDEIVDSATGSSGNLGTGGMATKVSAAKMLMPRGIHTFIVSGCDPTILFELLEGSEIGTLFKGEGK